MGQEIPQSAFFAEDFARFRARLAAETQALARFAAEGGFSDPRFFAGFELEAWLLDHAGFPSPVNDTYLAALADPLVVPELSRFNVELNAPPVAMGPGVIEALEASLDATWARCQDVAHGMDTVLAMIGILPTIREQDLSLATISAMKRYQALNAQVLEQRGGEPIHIAITGDDTLRLDRGDVMLEAATTSFQLHLQVPFAQAADYYNASLVSCGPLLAAAANSPLLFSRRLWQETRVPLFEQAVDVGGYEGLREAGIRRVGFGRGYVAASLVELFEENLAHFPPLLPIALDEPAARFPHVRLHNGAIWRWVRPLIGFDPTGRAHVRIEQRVLPSGPTVLDMMANAALYFGLVRALAARFAGRAPLLPFADARANFYAAARHGLDAELAWNDGARRPARALLLETCLPLAREGLLGFGLADDEIERYLGVIEARVRRGRTGAQWQLAHLRTVWGDAQRLMNDYLENQRTGAPVHEWPQ
jgi:hypothetical protein